MVIARLQQNLRVRRRHTSRVGHPAPGAEPRSPVGIAAGPLLVPSFGMPTVLRRGPYRFFFYSSDRAEPPHVHVERDENLAKFWLDPSASTKAAASAGRNSTALPPSSASTRLSSSRRGVSTSASDIEQRPGPAVTSVAVTDDAVRLELTDGRTITAPLAWYPRLAHGTPAERAHWRLVGRGAGVHWPDLDEDISLEGVLAGRPSGESQASLKRWLESRGAAA